MTQKIISICYNVFNFKVIPYKITKYGSFMYNNCISKPLSNTDLDNYICYRTGL